MCVCIYVPFNIAALPDLIASADMLAMTSGRASKMMSNTPIGHDTRLRTSPSSSRTFESIIPTVCMLTQIPE